VHHVLRLHRGDKPGKEIDWRLCGEVFNVQDEQTSPGARASKLSEPMWNSFFALHTGPWQKQATARGLTHER
jgi:hypothetical protein